MLLSDFTITRLVRQGRLIIDPFDTQYLQPNSYDIHLHQDFLYFTQEVQARGVLDRPLDPNEDCSWAFTKGVMPDDKPTLLMPDVCILGRSIERFHFPADIAGRIEGVSTNGRIFLTIHITAGFFDAGFPGTATLEIKNLGPRPIVLRPGMRIGQMAFQKLDRAAFNSYGSHHRYYGQVDPTPSRSLNSPSLGSEWEGKAVVADIHPRHDNEGDGSSRPEETILQPLYAGSDEGQRVGESQEPG